MSNNSSKKHHWFPLGLQHYWAGKDKTILRLDSSGHVRSKKITSKSQPHGQKIHGHTMFYDSVWRTNFEEDFGNADNKMRDVVDHLTRLAQSANGITELKKASVGIFRLLFEGSKHVGYQDFSREHRIDSGLSKHILLCLYSLLCRSPAFRNRCEQIPGWIGLPQNEEIGKMNMRTAYSAVLHLLAENAPIMSSFLLIKNKRNDFHFGDGIPDWTTHFLMSGALRGMALVPFTPSMAIYFKHVSNVRAANRLFVLDAPSDLTSEINRFTHVYCRQNLYFRVPPKNLPTLGHEGGHGKVRHESSSLLVELDQMFETE